MNNPVISKTGRALVRGLLALTRGLCHAALWPERAGGMFFQMTVTFVVAALLAFTHPWR